MFAVLVELRPPSRFRLPQHAQDHRTSGRAPSKLGKGLQVGLPGGGRGATVRQESFHSFLEATIRLLLVQRGFALLFLPLLRGLDGDEHLLQRLHWIWPIDALQCVSDRRTRWPMIGILKDHGHDRELLCDSEVVLHARRSERSDGLPVGRRRRRMRYECRLRLGRRLWRPHRRLRRLRGLLGWVVHRQVGGSGWLGVSASTATSRRHRWWWRGAARSSRLLQPRSPGSKCPALPGNGRLSGTHAPVCLPCHACVPTPGTRETGRRAR